MLTHPTQYSRASFITHLYSSSPSSSKHLDMLGVLLKHVKYILILGKYSWSAIELLSKVPKSEAPNFGPITSAPRY